ncbi:hypothetical protein FA13DRAFT_1740438 [Coprinellus micaceus]|uniref:Uncharacterized protein n=1 Tax=Coprinellus micaceus TaxID=71717 RepID=A0A4Y7SNW8_COPMI|nr:hypothetical protein FA13DRAFT_1740438 [Coprinellus micaceus]
MSRPSQCGTSTSLGKARATVELTWGGGRTSALHSRRETIRKGFRACMKLCTSRVLVLGYFAIPTARRGGRTSERLPFTRCWVRRSQSDMLKKSRNEGSVFIPIYVSFPVCCCPCRRLMSYASCDSCHSTCIYARQ